MITVHVKLFAGLRLAFPELQIGQALPVHVPTGTTIAQLSQRLHVTSFKLAMVNGVAQTENFVLQDNDQLALIPPLAGG